jgi:alkylation response protein AidB-like acyl-CoA dehydrogenase
VDFTVSEEQRMLVDSTRRLLADLSPISSVRRLAAAADRGYDQRVWQRGSELGWAALPVPEEHGGLGQSIVDVALIAAEHGRTVQPGPLISSALFTFAVARSGRPDLQAAVLPALAAGEETATWAFAEPHQPWDAAGITTAAVFDGGVFRLAGVKTAVQDADSARWILVTARLDGQLAQFLVSRDTPGLSMRRQQTIDITRRLHEVRLDDAQIPAAALLTPPTAGQAAVSGLLARGAVLISADSVGVGERLLEMSVEYARLRVQFGRPIGSFQAIKHKCANMRMWLQASKAATYYAAMAVAAGADDAAEAASIAKAYTSEAIPTLAGEALQLHGGIGFTWEHDLHLYLRRAKANQMLFGAPYLHYEYLLAALERGAGPSEGDGPAPVRAPEPRATAG